VASQAHIEYLFDPAGVRDVVASYPALAVELKPDQEGVKAAWFERVRKSPRQVYRVLGNTQYKHLTELLEALDACMAHGYMQPRLLRTRARSSFAPDLAELRTAEHFVLAGCEIAGFDDAKGEESVPDLVATTKDGFRVAVEVYCPMAFEHLERLKDDLTSGVKNIDSPYDFGFRLEFEKVVEFDPGTMMLAYLRPDVLDAALGDDGRGPALVAAILDDLAAQLDDPGETLEIVREEGDLNLRIALELEHIELAPDSLPARMGFIGGPSTLVPAPEFVFARIAERAEDKAQKGQALQVDADASVLVVDLSESDLPSELRHEMYHRKFREILEPRAGKALHGHTAIVFAETAGWHQPFIPWFLNTADGAPTELFELLDPRGIYPRP
jgi:hypothetical protein